MPFKRSAILGTLLSAGLLVGCGDDPAGSPLAPSLARDKSGGTEAAPHKATFTVYPDKAVSVVLGEHKIMFGEDAICDPDNSTYGPTEWLQPCAPATEGVRITARWYTDAAGNPAIDFQPALRFNPASKVTLFLMDKDESLRLAGRAIYFRDHRGVLIDESLTDPTVGTKVGRNGYLYRRIRHFSGYLISTGRDDGSMSDSY